MRFEDYRDKYPVIRMERDDRGILEMTFHTDGGPLRWGHIGGPHSFLSAAFADVARDPENRVVIMTGTGDEFSGPPASKEGFPRSNPEEWEVILRNGLTLTQSLLEIDAIVISCINGPALRHAEVPLLGDIVLAADSAVIQDSAHFVNRTVPGDGVNLLFPLWMGLNRGRYFLLTGETIDAQRALELGLVSEVLPRNELLPRARMLAERLIEQNPLVLKYTRRMFTAPLKRMMADYLGYGLALEGLAVIHETMSGPYGEADGLD